MKIGQTSKFVTKLKPRLLFKKISLLAFLLGFSVVNSIDTLEVNKDELTRKNIFTKVQMVANASELNGSSGVSAQSSLKEKSSLKRKRRFRINKKRRNRRRTPAQRITRIRRESKSSGICINFSNGTTSGRCNPSFKGKN